MNDNLLYYGDNLDVLCRHVKDESVQMVHLDPPFNSNASYNVLFAAKDGHQASAQIEAFEDTWRWDESAARQFAETVEVGVTWPMCCSRSRSSSGRTTFWPISR